MEINERILFEIKHRFYYIEYPEGVPEQLWKDREGDCIYMSEMGLDHLKASIRLIEKNLKDFKKSYERTNEWSELSKTILPLVSKKLQELKDVFNEKARI